MHTMSRRSTEHATFVIERTFPVPPARVFAAFASAEAKLRWFGPPTSEDMELEFRVGGRERFAAEGPDGARYTYEALYQDIVSDERIVYTYEMCRDEDRMSVSVTTIELNPAAPGAAAGAGTELRMTEQGVFLDGHDTSAAREHGTRELIEKLAEALAS
jgi:uncharacterized protein YndB with AHSA1/START domain